MAILVEKEPIKLAPSSSQIPALLAKTKQNIFDVRAQHQAAQRSQQRPAAAARDGAGVGAGARAGAGQDASAPAYKSLPAAKTEVSFMVFYAV